MFCPQCGKKCPDDSRFCEHCGSMIQPPPAPAPAPRPVSAPGPFPAAAPVAPPVLVKKKSRAGLIAALAAVVVLLAAAGGGAFYVMQLRSANEAALSASLMDHMWDYCEADVIEYYDGVLAEPYDERGYKVDMKSSSFTFRPQTEKNVFPVTGRVDIIDRNDEGAVYRVDIEGTVRTDFLRKNFDWDLSYDFEEPPVREPENEEQPEDQPPEAAGEQAPAPEDSIPPDNPLIEEESGYLWPTDSQYITDADLSGFSRKEIMLMRNELYARYGCSFRDEEIRTYFESRSWYKPNPDLLAVDFLREWFNEYETANLDTILNYEKAQGWRG